jgi:hypothetical protein
MNLKVFQKIYKKLEVDLFTFCNNEGLDINSIISAMPFLETLYNKKLLFFSTKYVNRANKIAGSYMNQNISSSIKTYLDRSSVIFYAIKKYLEDMKDEFTKLNDIAKHYLNLLVNCLINIDNATAPSTFEGLAIEFVPFLYSDG